MLGNRLREFRKSRGLTLQQVADAVQMDIMQLSRLERMIAGCSDEKKLALARFFGVPITELFFVEKGEVPA
jgi:transcriptional regulator with XRE-family HTH domain